MLNTSPAQGLLIVGLVVLALALAALAGFQWRRADRNETEANDLWADVLICTHAIAVTAAVWDLPPSATQPWWNALHRADPAAAAEYLTDWNERHPTRRYDQRGMRIGPEQAAHSDDPSLPARPALPIVKQAATGGGY